MKICINRSGLHGYGRWPRLFRLVFAGLSGCLFIFALASHARAWSSMDQSELQGAFGTHQFLTEAAYKKMMEHPAIKEKYVKFPSKEDIRLQAGIDVYQAGNGPDNPNHSKYSYHWYNPVYVDDFGKKGAGVVPAIVSKYQEKIKTAFENQNLIPPGATVQLAHDMAYAAHYIQDLTCSFHVIGIPRNGRVITDVYGGHVALGPFWDQSTEAWRLEQWRRSALYANEDEDQKSDWFDATYYDGYWFLNNMGSSHFLYEALVEIVFHRDWLGSHAKWSERVNKPPEAYISSGWQNASSIENFAERTGAETRNFLDARNPEYYFDLVAFQNEVQPFLAYEAPRQLKDDLDQPFELYSQLLDGHHKVGARILEIGSKYVEIPYGPWWRAVQATYTLWRASFSALVVPRGSEGMQLVKIPDQPNVYQLKIRLKNLDLTDSARGIQVAYEASTGAKGERNCDQPIPAGKYGPWMEMGKIVIANPDKITATVKFTLTSRYEDTPDSGKTVLEYPLKDIKTNTIAFPRLVGKTKNGAIKILTGSPFGDYKFNVQWLSAGNPVKEKDSERITEQNPAEGVWVGLNEKVTLKAYENYFVEVPDVLDKQKGEASRLIRDAGFKMTLDLEPVNASVAENIVKRQIPAPKKLAPRGSRVIVFLSTHQPVTPQNPLPSSSAQEPVMRDMVITPATATIKVGERVKLEVLPIDINGNAVSNDILKVMKFEWFLNETILGSVSGHGPTAEFSANYFDDAESKTVKVLCRTDQELAVASITIIGALKPGNGQEKIEVPSVEHFNINQASEILQKINLAVDARTLGNAVAKESSLLVQQQTPPAGTLVDPGSAVTLLYYGPFDPSDLLANIDCRSWQGSVPTFDPSSQNVYCDCQPPVSAWNVSRTFCVDCTAAHGDFYRTLQSGNVSFAEEILAQVPNCDWAAQALMDLDVARNQQQQQQRDQQNMALMNALVNSMQNQAQNLANQNQPPPPTPLPQPQWPNQQPSAGFNPYGGGGTNPPGNQASQPAFQQPQPPRTPVDPPPPTVDPPKPTNPPKSAKDCERIYCPTCGNDIDLLGGSMDPQCSECRSKYRTEISNCMAGHDSGAPAAPAAREYYVGKCPQYDSTGRLSYYLYKTGKTWELNGCESVFNGTWDECHRQQQSLEESSGFRWK